MALIITKIIKSTELLETYSIFSYEDDVAIREVLITFSNIAPINRSCEDLEETLNIKLKRIIYSENLDIGLENKSTIIETLSLFIRIEGYNYPIIDNELLMRVIEKEENEQLKRKYRN